MKINFQFKFMIQKNKRFGLKYLILKNSKNIVNIKLSKTGSDIKKMF